MLTFYDQRNLAKRNTGRRAIGSAGRPTGRPAEPPVRGARGRTAVAVYRGSHNDAELTYAAVGSYLAEHDMSTAGPVREYYLIGSDGSTNVENWRTEIF